MDGKDNVSKPTSKKAKQDVDDFLSSLGVDAQAYSSSDRTPKASSSPVKDSGDVFSFLDKLSENKAEVSSPKTLVIDQEPSLETVKINSPDLKSTSEPQLEAVKINSPNLKTVSEPPKDKVVSNDATINPKESKNEKNEENQQGNSWSFGGLWSTASSAIKNTQNSEYFKLNVESMKHALSEISETVRSNENAQYLGSAVKDLVDSEKLAKIGTDLKNYTQQSVSSVMTSFQDTEGHNTLNVHFYSDQDYKRVENLAYQMLDPLLEEELLFQDINFFSANALIDFEDAFWKEKCTSSKISQGFKEGFDLSKSIAQKICSDFKTVKEKSVDANTESKSDVLFSKLEDQILSPTVTTNAFLVIVPCRAAPLPDVARIFYSLVLVSPEYPDNVFQTFSQPLPACSVLYSSKTKETSISSAKTSSDLLEEEHKAIALKAIQMAIHFLLIDFFNTVAEVQKAQKHKASKIEQI